MFLFLSIRFNLNDFNDDLKPMVSGKFPPGQFPHPDEFPPGSGLGFGLGLG